jgi:hypothetical protein
MSVMRHYNADDARREAIVQAMKGHVRAARLDAEYDADIEYMEHALVALVDEQLQGAVDALAEALAVLTDPERPDRAARNQAVAIIEALDTPTSGGQ